MTGWEWVEAASWVAALIGLPFGVVAAMLPPGYSRVVLEEAGGRRTHEIRADVGHSAGEPESPREEPK
jgi:hypothetical protein